MSLPLVDISRNAGLRHFHTEGALKKKQDAASGISLSTTLRFLFLLTEFTFYQSYTKSISVALIDSYSL